MSKAFIQKPAPAFAGTAVNHHGEFIDVKLSDYKGMNEVFLDYTQVCFEALLLLTFCYCVFTGKYLVCSSIPSICKYYIPYFMS